MASPSYTYTLANSTTADADEVMQNFNDILNGVSDGTKDISVAALTVAGNANFNGNTTLGNATGDTITVTGRIASDVNPSANASYDLGSSALSYASLYLDNDSTDGGAIYFDAGSTKFIKSNAAGTVLDFGGFTSLTGGQLKALPNSTLKLDTGNGHGSTNTAIRRFTNAGTNAGDGFTYADSAANGMSLTIARDMIIHISYTDGTTALQSFGISINSSQLTTSILSITTANRLVSTQTSGAESPNVSVTVAVSSGDVIRAHTDGGSLSAAAKVQFVAQEVMRI